MVHKFWFMKDRMKKSFPLSGSNSDILPGERTEELKAGESRFDLLRIFSRALPRTLTLADP